MRIIDLDYKPDNLEEITLILSLSPKELDRLISLGSTILEDMDIIREENENKFKERRADYNEDGQDDR